MQMPDATLARLIWPALLQSIEIMEFVGRIRCLQRIRQSVQMPDATLGRLIWPTLLQSIEIMEFVGRIRCLHRIRQSVQMPDATLGRFIWLAGGYSLSAGLNVTEER
ncbi:hypothetical protein [Escherichia albertii]|uniref:hypothetical protein n=1 Tax=Escherichia albertii TaxID=208962 RepID=UPI0011614B77|nr:hypothetical protein [Escherichia albertii]